MDEVRKVLKLLESSANGFERLYGDLYAACVKTEGSLDEKTKMLIYLSVLGALGASTSLEIHVNEALSMGISRQEIIEALLVAVPATGITPLLSSLRPILEELS